MYNRPGAAGSHGHLWDKVHILNIPLFASLSTRVGQYQTPSWFSEFSLCFLRRQKPYVIRSPRRRLAVEVQLENRLENAYNTSLTLHYSRNLHFSSLSIRVNPTYASHTHVYRSIYTN